MVTTWGVDRYVLGFAYPPPPNPPDVSLESNQSVQTAQRSFGLDFKLCCPCRRSIEHENTNAQIIQHALKVSESSVLKLDTVLKLDSVWLGEKNAHRI